MKIGYFIQNYKRGGVNTFIKNLVSKNIFKDEIIVITNHNNPGVNFLKKKIKNITFLEYSIFSWDKIFNMNLNNLILLFLKIIYSVFFPISFIYQFIRLFFFFKKNKLDKIMIDNGGYPGGDLCIAAALAWNKINPNERPWMNFHNFALKKYKFFLLNFYKNYIDIILAKSVMGFVSLSKICTNSIKERKNLKNVKTSTIYNGHIFSKSAEKTFEFWDKKYTIQRMIRIVRAYKPDIIIPTFLDVEGQHGHHRAVTKATIEAFDNSNDPDIFPDDNFGPWKYLRYFSLLGVEVEVPMTMKKIHQRQLISFKLVIIIIYLVEHIIKLVSGLAHIMQLKILEN